jgi:hypothetical protein
MRPLEDLEHSVNLSPEHLQAIGKVAVRWAELEDTLSSIIWDLANLDRPMSLAITTHLSERTRADICTTLADTILHQKSLAKTLRKHIDKIITQIYPKRNAVIHSVWGYSIDEGISTILPIKARGELKIGPRIKYSSSDIFDIAEEIYSANAELYSLRCEIQEALANSSKHKALSKN